MPFKTTPSPVAKERSRTVYTNKNSFKTTPAPGAKQRSRTAYIRNIPFKRHRLPERNNGPGPFTSECLVQNGTGSRSQTVPDRLYNKYLVQKRHRLPEPNSPRPLHKGKNITLKTSRGARNQQTVPDRSQVNIYSNKTPAPRAERSRTVYTNKIPRSKQHRLPEPNGPGPLHKSICKRRKNLYKAKQRSRSGTGNYRVDNKKKLRTECDLIRRRRLSNWFKNRLCHRFCCRFRNRGWFCRQRR